jgi:asparagine synthase (glutamine-hydrolysing)
MCGIAGYADIARRSTPDPRILTKMAATMTHRGPDSSGRFVAEHVGMAVRRLSIVDPRSGDQPIENEDGTVVVCCNGEIFNHRELREKLTAAGHTFRSSCDVEVLVHLYEDLGASLVHHLNGQFSFALYDSRRRSLLLARDPVGITPLHYTVAKGNLIFGSEVKALLAHPDVSREVDLTGLDQILVLPGLVSPRTMFAGISSLPPGHMLTLQDGDVRIEQYWDLDYPLEASLPRDADLMWQDHAARLEQALRRSVELRMRADVPRAYYLSGGLDSSLVAALAAALAPADRVATFSVTFPDDRISEVRFQRLMANALASTHTEVPLTPDDLLDGLHQAIWHSECPIKESYNVASLALSRAVRDSGAKVVLTGEGADELFAGYAGYKYDRMRTERARRQNQPPARDEITAWPWANPLLIYGREAPWLERTRRALYSPALVDRLESFSCLAQPLVDVRKLAGRHIMHQRSYLDFKLRLADHLLGDHGDRMALANSVEARYPFLDTDVIECARTLPPDLALHDFEEKYLLKRVAESYLPAEIVAREKFAFQANTSPDLIRLGSTWADSYLSPRRIRNEGYFDPDVVKELQDRYSDDEYSLNLIVQDDLLMTVITHGIFLETFGLPYLS